MLGNDTDYVTRVCRNITKSLKAPKEESLIDLSKPFCG